MKIEDILQRAKADMLSQSEHRPVIHIEAAIGPIIKIELESFSWRDAYSKQKKFFTVGREYGVAHRGAEIRALAFVSEAWVSHNEAYAFPDEDPERREMIVVSLLTIDAEKVVGQKSYMAEIIRAGDTVDLLPYEHMEVVYNKLLIAFLAGFASAKMNDREFALFVASYARST